MSHFYTREQFEEAADHIRGQTQHRPQVGLILGSGLNPLAEAVQAVDLIPYSDIPHFPKPTVEGHVGQLVLGLLEGMPIMVMQDRAHFYEGYPIQQIGFPVRVMQLMEVQTLIVTNAAGGLSSAFRPGDLMLINDHLNLMGVGGLRHSAPVSRICPGFTIPSFVASRWR
jgi:purine-nucleoside phosphorylase